MAISSTDDLLVWVSTRCVQALGQRWCTEGHQVPTMVEMTAGLSRCCVVLGSAAAAAADTATRQVGDILVSWSIGVRLTFVCNRKLKTANSSLKYSYIKLGGTGYVKLLSIDHCINNGHDLNKCIIVPNPSIYQAVNNTAIYLYLVHLLTSSQVLWLLKLLSQ